MHMELKTLRYAVCGAVAGALAACGGGSSGSSSATSAGASVAATQYGNVPMVVSDDSSQDWATIGVKVLSIALIPQSGGSDVTVYTAPSAPPYINLEQLDQLGELLGNAQVPVGTYTGAIVTVSGNPGDVILTTSLDPQAGFSLPGSTVVPSSNIQIQHTQGSAGALSVPISLNFVSPLVVSTTATATAALDIEFDLAHPAFIVGHMPPGATATQWAVNFEGPVRHHPLADLRRLVLRHTYGTVTAISSDNTSITITKDFPALPAVSPETAVASTQTLSILADATNGTLLYDVDAKAVTSITSFASESSLAGKYVRVAARYQGNGTLVATRIWASTSFNSVWFGPEGHVSNVNANSNVLTVLNEDGIGVPMQVNSSTRFYFRQPWNGQADATPIGTGTGFLANQDIVRGFKVHASVVDPLAVPLVAQEVDIETAEYSGAISESTSSGFTTTHDFVRAIDNYSVALPFIAEASANGNDPVTGMPITGYKWWNFAYPTLLDSGSAALADYVSATDGTASFGGTAGAIVPWALSYTTWADPANATGWSAAASILEPTPLPVGTVVAAPATSGSEVVFSISALNGTQAVSVEASTTSGSATLVYQVDDTNGIVTLSPIDITTPTGLANFTTGLATGAKVRVSGVPQVAGTVKAYVVTYYTGTAPAS